MPTRSRDERQVTTTELGNENVPDSRAVVPTPMHSADLVIVNDVALLIVNWCVELFHELPVMLTGLGTVIVQMPPMPIVTTGPEVLAALASSDVVLRATKPQVPAVVTVVENDGNGLLVHDDAASGLAVVVAINDEPTARRLMSAEPQEKVLPALSVSTKVVLVAVTVVFCGSQSAAEADDALTSQNGERHRERQLFAVPHREFPFLVAKRGPSMTTPATFEPAPRSLPWNAAWPIAK
jgi:hypothetical protein